MVIRLYYEELSDEASKNSRSNLKQFSEGADLHHRESSGRVREIIAEKAGMSLGGKGGLKEGLPDLADLPVSRDVSEELAKKAGIGRSSMTYLIAVYRNSSDLSEVESR